MANRSVVTFAVSMLVLLALSGTSAAQYRAGKYSCSFDSTGYTAPDTTQSVNVSGIFGLTMGPAGAISSDEATLSVADGGAGPAVCTYSGGSGSVAPDTTGTGFATASLSYQPAASNSGLCPLGDASLTFAPVAGGLTFVYTNLAGFVGNGTCGIAGVPPENNFACSYKFSNATGVGSGIGQVLFNPALNKPGPGGLRVAVGPEVDDYPGMQCPYLLVGTATYPLPLLPNVGSWGMAGPTLPGCPARGPFSEVLFTTTQDTILITASQISSAVCTPSPGPGNLAAVPPSVNFGSHRLNSITSRNIEVTNTGASVVIISGVTVTTLPNDFSETDNCKRVLAPGNSCTITASFRPTARRALSSSLKVTSDLNPLTIPLMGTGT